MEEPHQTSLEYTDESVTDFSKDYIITTKPDSASLNEPVKIYNKVYNFGQFTLNLNFRRLHLGDEVKHLSLKETELLSLLLDNVGIMISRSYILTSIWGSDTYFTSRSMDVIIHKLRKHLRTDTSVQILNVRKGGFLITF